MTSEAEIQSEFRRLAAYRGERWYRNNNGAWKDPETGRLIRYGLGNDSKPVSDRLKSSDLIGWRPVLITPAHVGRTIAQFGTAETKPAGWHLTPGDKRGQAQAAWIRLVLHDGGFGGFVTDGGIVWP